MHMGITQEISDFIAAASEELKEKRKSFAPPDDMATVEAVQTYSLLTSQPLHATKQGGILWASYHPSLHHVIATAGEDCTIQIFDQSAQRILSSIEEHFKKVHGLEWIGDLLLASCSADKSVRVWMRESDEGWDMKCGLNIKAHEEDVIGVTSDPNGRFLISASRDATLGFIDLEQGKCLERIASAVVDVPYTCTQFHPEGRLLGAGTEAGDIHVWDMAQQKIVKSFTDDNAAGSIHGLSFHQNGSQMATATDETVKLWDLRKMESLKELKPVEDGSIRSVRFDQDGRFFAIGASDLRLYDAEEALTPIMSFSEFPGRVRCLAFSQGVQSIAAGSTDHNLRIFGRG